MIEPFLGTWKLVSSENFEEYMKQLGEKYHYEIWKLATRFVMWLGLHTTMNFPTILSFVILGNSHVRLTNFMYLLLIFLLTGNNGLFLEYEDHRDFLLVIICIFKSIYPF